MVGTRVLGGFEIWAVLGGKRAFRMGGGLVSHTRKSSTKKNVINHNNIKSFRGGEAI
jgi:hypothetical protein